MSDDQKHSESFSELAVRMTNVHHRIHEADILISNSGTTGEIDLLVDTAQAIRIENRIFASKTLRDKLPKTRAALNASTTATKVGSSKIVEFSISILLSPAKADALIGDLSERFVRNCARYGAERARWMYWGQVFRSLGPLLLRAMGRAAKWGFLIDAVRRFL
jgi:hypothetical protein